HKLSNSPHRFLSPLRLYVFLFRTLASSQSRPIVFYHHYASSFFFFVRSQALKLAPSFFITTTPLHFSFSHAHKLSISPIVFYLLYASSFFFFARTQALNLAPSFLITTTLLRFSFSHARKLSNSPHRFLSPLRIITIAPYRFPKLPTR
ncbi:MAG: hypothetical protein PF448_10240, partial [Bacteroidales bacterium]|nr:hypothetical protein [Bacteroidales bacterium]